MPFAMPPGLRLAYDTDGTIGLFHPDASVGGGVQEISPDALAAMNSTYGAGAEFTLAQASTDYYRGLRIRSDVSDAAEASVFYALLFPVPHRLRGIFITTYPADWYRIETSVDTTNGLDGTWTLLDEYVLGTNVPLIEGLTSVNLLTGARGTQTAISPKDYYRLLQHDNTDGVGIMPLAGVAARNVSGVRIYPYRDRKNPSSGNSLPLHSMHLHLYGEPDTEAQGSDYLQGWRADSDMRLGGATLNFGDVPLSSSSDKQFRIKNQSASHTANNVVISASDLMFYPIPSPAAQFVFSLDGMTWTSSVTVSAIGPGTVSSVIYVRRVTPANAALTTWSPKLNFVVGGWT